MELTIRTMQPEDASWVAALSRRCLYENWSETSLAGECKTPGAIWLTAKIGNELCGYIGMRIVIDEGEIVSLAVEEPYRRLGIGAKLLREALKRCNEKGAASLFLEVRASNQNAISLYQKFGFFECGRRRGFYTHPKEDALIFCRYREKQI